METYSDDFIMLPKVDFAFKEIMANAIVRKGFLSAVLGIDPDEIKSTVIENTNMRVLHEDEKLCILDVRVLLNSDVEIDIEIQLAYYGTWDKRATFYLSKLLTEQTGVNKIYSNLKKCVGINILDFSFVNSPDFHTVYHLREDTTGEMFTDILELHIIELPKLPSQSTGTPLYDWTRFIKSKNKEELKMAAKNNTYIQEAYNQLETISQDRQKQIDYTSRMKAVMDYNTIMEERFNDGLKKGITQGIAQGISQGIAQGITQGITQGIAQGRKEGIKAGKEEIIAQLRAANIIIPDDILKLLE